MSEHISARPGEIAASVLLPGDPLRAKYIAENYLEDPVLINTIRGMSGYTGKWNGKPVTVFPTGMGTPAMMIYATELVRDYGCQNLVRLGTCGGIQDDINVGDLIISTATSTTSGINLYDLPGTFAPAADFVLLQKAVNIARERNLPIHVGTTLCNDHYYVENKADYSRKWAKYGVLASEQEGVGLYTVAAREGARALMILDVAINLYRPEECQSAEEKEKGLDDLVRLGLDTVTA